MSIIDLQKRARRLGEIRLGDTKTVNGKTFPVSLDTFRLTSSAKGLLAQVGELYGGTVEPWNTRHQIITDTDELAVVIPPQDPDSVTWYEHWTAGGLQRRCDGENIVNRDDPTPCICNPERRECRMVTRLQVMIPQLPDVGVWTLSSTGYYAATELAMSIDIVMKAAHTTGLLPDAVLAIEHREVKRPGEPTKKFVVPVLRFTDTLSTFLPGSGVHPSPLPAQGGAVPLPGGTDGGSEAAGPVHSVPSPPPPPDDDIPHFHIDLTGGKELPTVKEVAPVVEAALVDDAAAERPDTINVDVWGELLTLLEDTPDDGTMGEVQKRVYRLFELMHTAELWPEHARQASLKKLHGHTHLTQLRKGELNLFACQAFTAAREKASDA